ncbi:hypothetical protein [Oryzicola mucosus]|uniref:Glycosyltransferase RgtA/B/C/D-like domain-containing protein n=1 Tax=Oryzicola mucosus TaxID=2767425 RepID=A0A8J6PWX5_9HYPH|nr:hypothetical protein [Oryzicola mucosus]MBD0415748.1 hypothetical protein [Oryzicola mucosus]
MKRLMAIGMLGVFLTYVAVVGLYMVAIKGSDDSLLHLDYAWQLSQGRFPDWNDGTKIPINTGGENFRMKPQYVSHHPPLYYAFLAPTVGATVEWGDWRSGVMAARLLTFLVGVGCVAAFFWTAWAVSQSPKITMTVGAFAAAWTPFVKVSGDVMNDVAAVLTSTLAIGLCALIIRRGVQPRYVARLALVCAMGMASRATFVGMFALSLCVVLWTTTVFSEDRRHGLRRGLLYCCVIVLGVAVASGWFYYGNYLESGSWYRKADQSWVAKAQGRKLQGLWNTITDIRVYTNVLSRMYGNPWERWGAYNITASWVVSCTILFGLFVVSFRKKTIQDKAIVALCMAMFAINILFIIWHAKGYGSLNVRYMLPSTIVVALAAGYAATIYAPLSPFGATALIIAGWLGSIGNVIWYVSATSDMRSGNSFNDYLAGAAEIGFPPIIVYIFFVLAAAGAIAQAYAIFKLAYVEKITPRTRSPLPMSS